MKLGIAGLNLIKSFETLKLVAYKPTPDDVLTIGWGSTRGVLPGMEITEEEADARLSQDLSDAETCVNKRINGIALTQNAYDALVSLCFNIGCRQFNTSSVLRFLLDGNDERAAQSFRLWNKQRDKKTGAMKVVDGLTDRRAKEEALFRSTV